jgi:hypothetical protein
VTTRDGTATAGADYTALDTVLNWADGDAAIKTLTIALINDAANEADEQFFVTLGTPAGGATLDGGAELAVTIANDDAPAPAPPPAGSSGGGGRFEWAMLLELGLWFGVNSLVQAWGCARIRARTDTRAGRRLLRRSG